MEKPHVNTLLVLQAFSFATSTTTLPLECKQNKDQHSCIGTHSLMSPPLFFLPPVMKPVFAVTWTDALFLWSETCQEQEPYYPSQWQQIKA
jgi:hypothetical protein